MGWARWQQHPGPIIVSAAGGGGCCSPPTRAALFLNPIPCVTPDASGITTEQGCGHPVDSEAPEMQPRPDSFAGDWRRSRLPAGMGLAEPTLMVGRPLMTHPWARLASAFDGKGST